MSLTAIQITDIVKVRCHQQKVDFVRTELWVFVRRVAEEFSSAFNNSVNMEWTMICEIAISLNNRTLLNVRVNLSV